MSNWAMELCRWAPKLKVVQYKGTAEERDDIYRQKVCML
jgi:SNF2 family DNA or RNA helicase